MGDSRRTFDIDNFPEELDGVHAPPVLPFPDKWFA
jgi:hypothetical protein